MGKSYVETKRLDANRVSILNEFGLDITLFANEEVPVDRASLLEARQLGEIAETVRLLNRQRFFGDLEAVLRRCILTPDFHKGAGIPIGTVLDAHGFVLPRCVGGDIGCGMRLIATDISLEDFQSIGKKLDDRLRHMFFAGGRDIPMTESGREGILREGIAGLKAPDGRPGIWKHISDERMEKEASFNHQGGSWKTKDSWNFQEYIKGSGGLSHDSAIASIGKGNHFVERQYVEDIIDKQTAWRWGLKRDCVTLMIHTGSVGLGSQVGGHFMDLAKKIFPANVKAPEHGYYMLPTHDEGGIGDDYLSAMNLCANFAVVNRFMLGELAILALEESLGRKVSRQLVYDAPHNLIWSDGQDHIHRKGACPAGLNMMDANFPDGHPVILPGSMGDYSFVLKGHGNIASICSAPHGAGRLKNRGESRKGQKSELECIRVVTPLDFATMVRQDIKEEYMSTLMEEAPSQYKPVMPAIETVSNANIASAVVKLKPLLTVKA